MKKFIGIWVMVGLFWLSLGLRGMPLDWPGQIVKDIVANISAAKAQSSSRAADYGGYPGSGRSSLNNNRVSPYGSSYTSPFTNPTPTISGYPQTYDPLGKSMPATNTSSWQGNTSLNNSSRYDPWSGTNKPGVNGSTYPGTMPGQTRSSTSGWSYPGSGTGRISGSGSTYGIP